MEHVPAGKHEWNPSSENTFTGKVWSSFLSKAEDRTATAIGVMFGPGARSYWHSHPEGQLLYVTSGAGRAGSADGKVVEIAAGDVIYTPGGEQHWHGANPISYMMHVSITTGGTTIWTPREVTDEEYNAV